MTQVNNIFNDLSFLANKKGSDPLDIIGRVEQANLESGRQEYQIELIGDSGLNYHLLAVDGNGDGYVDEVRSADLTPLPESETGGLLSKARILISEFQHGLRERDLQFAKAWFGEKGPDVEVKEIGGRQQVRLYGDLLAERTDANGDGRTDTLFFVNADGVKVRISKTEKEMENEKPLGWGYWKSGDFLSLGLASVFRLREDEQLTGARPYLESFDSSSLLYTR